MFAAVGSLIAGFALARDSGLADIGERRNHRRNANASVLPMEVATLAAGVGLVLGRWCFLLAHWFLPSITSEPCDLKGAEMGAQSRPLSDIFGCILGPKIFNDIKG